MVKPMELWYAVRVRSNYEKHVRLSLRGKGFETFLPLYSKLSKWSDRVREIDAPLFPGYVFGRFDAVRRLPVLLTPGVVNIVGNATGPLSVDEEELNGVRRLVESGGPIAPWAYLAAGDIVEVERGALTGLRGILLRVKDACRLIVSLTLLQRSVAVEMDCDSVRLVTSRGSAPDLVFHTGCTR